MNFLAQNPINEEMGLDFDEVLSQEVSSATYAPSSENASNGGAFMGSFDGDPQGREESTLGSGSGSSMGDSTLGGGGGSVTSDSSVYTKNLGGKSFVNPFGN
mgnify:FL=1